MAAARAGSGPGVTHLMVAASRGDHDEVRQLLAAGACEVNAQDGFGNTALIYAAAAGRTGIVRLLLAAGADPGTRNSLGATASDRAKAHGHAAVAFELSRGRAADVGGKDVPEGPRVVVTAAEDLALFRSCREGALARAEAALSAGAEVEARSPEAGWTPLINAVVGGHAAVAALVIDWGADPDTRCSAGRTALSYATALGDAEMMLLLLHRGADPNARGPGGRTALMEAAREGNASAVILLLARGADPSLLDEGGRTACELAVGSAAAAFGKFRGSN